MAAFQCARLRSMSTPGTQCAHYGARHRVDIVRRLGTNAKKAAALCEVGHVCEGVNGRLCQQNDEI